MKKSIRLFGNKIFVGMLVFCMMAGMIFTAPVTAHATTLNVPIKVTYGQTEARTMIESINNLRTDPDQAWAYDENNNKQNYTGLSPLQYDYGLERIAMKRAAEIALSYGHTRPNGQRCFTAYDISYRSAGENIAAGSSSIFSSADQVFNAWKEENKEYSGQGHRRNMLSSGITAVGIGHVKFEGMDYWVQEFSGPGTGESDSGARNETAVENIETIDSNIQGMKADRSSISLKKGETLDVSNLKILLSVSNHFGGYVDYFPVEADYEANLSDTSIAEYVEGKLTGREVGKTTLMLSAFGRTCNIEVQVTEPVAEEQPETPEKPSQPGKPVEPEKPEEPEDPEKPDPSGSGHQSSTQTSQPAKTYKIAVSGKLHLVITGKNGKNDNASVTWKTSNGKYATVNSAGVVKFKKAGIGKTVTVTAISKADGKVITTAKIKILKNAVTGIKVKNAPKTLKAGKSITLKPVVTVSGRNANKKILWSSSNSKYLTVNSNGKVVAKKAGKGKTVYVYGKAADGSGKSVRIKIRIN